MNIAPLREAPAGDVSGAPTLEVGGSAQSDESSDIGIVGPRIGIKHLGS